MRWWMNCSEVGPQRVEFLRVSERGERGVLTSEPPEEDNGTNWR